MEGKLAELTIEVECETRCIDGLVAVLKLQNEMVDEIEVISGCSDSAKSCNDE